MNVTVCELRNDPAGLERDWSALVDHTIFNNSDLVLLPEMTFHPWLAGTNQVNLQLWQEAVHAHDCWLERMSELSAPIVMGSRPVIQGQRRLNQGYIWQAKSGCTPVHAKYYLPDGSLNLKRAASWG